MFFFVNNEEQYVRKYGSKDTTPLSCDITAFGGINDIAINKDHLMTWKNLTKGTFLIKMFPGSHFFFNEHPMQLFRKISKMCLS